MRGKVVFLLYMSCKVLTSNYYTTHAQIIYMINKWEIKIEKSFRVVKSDVDLI